MDYYASLFASKVSGGGGGGGSGEWTSDGIAQNLEPNGAVTLSGSVTSIADRAFMLKPITSISGSGVTLINASALEGCSSLASVSFPSLVELKTSVFRDCKALVSLSLPTLTTLGADNIRQCSNLLSASIPNATKVPNYTFYDNEKMTSVDISSATEINSNAFQQCYAIEFIDCPSVTKISASAFINARKLSTLVLRSQNLVTLDNVNAFTNTAITGYNGGSGTIYVPSSLVSSYQTASNWSNIYGQGHVTFAAIEGSIYE